MNFVAIGEFMGVSVEELDKKDGTGKFKVAQLMIEMDNTYEKRDGTKVEKKSVVPFKVFGRTLEEAEALKFGETAKITFELEGRKWVDPKNNKEKYFCDNKAIFVNRIAGIADKAQGDNIPFPDPPKKEPWE